MGFAASRLNLRLFIDGLETPVIGARCTFSEGQPASAEVQVIATDEVYELPPRSLITLFYYETHDYGKDKTVGETTKLGPTDQRRWKLLFMGELAGIAFQKRSGQRAAILQCIDLTTYWDYIKQHYLNFRNGGIEFFENAFMGVKNDRIKNFDVVGKDVHSNLFVWLSKEKFTDENGESHSSLYLGVQRLLREMFFSSSFFSQQFNRLRMGNLIVGLPEDQTAGKLFKLGFFEKFIKNRVGGAGGNLTARAMVNMLLSPVFHTYVVVPCPMFDPDGEALGLDGASDNDLSKLIICRNKHVGASLNYIVIKPDAWFLAPPICNVVFPHMYSSIAYQRNFLAEPTRLFLRTSLLFSGSDKWLTERFYAPDFETFNQQLYAEGGYLERLAGVLLPHEEFVGINPTFTWQDDLSAYAQKGARREYLAQLADYLFWKYRFSTRTLNTSGPFNPNLLIGYPGVVMDRVPVGTATSRHFVGHVQTVVHSITQEGGITHMTMVAARTHDEQNDFDFTGRTLEELAVKQDGTGFIDDRYSFQKIGPEVYQKLFGCDSIMDFTDVTETGDEGDILIPVPSTVEIAVDNLSNFYKFVVDNGYSVNSLTLSLTQRPKANMIDIMGIPVTQGPVGTGGEQETANEYLLAQGVEPEGFMSTAVDNQSSDFQNDTFVSAKTSTIIKKTPRKENKTVGEYTDQAGDVQSIVVKIPTGEFEENIVPITKFSKGSYELQAHLEARQEKVQAYLDSLLFRGLRG